MADGIQAFADVLGGFGAGVSGNLIPFQEQQERKRQRTALSEQKARESDAERQKTLLIDGSNMFKFAQAGNFQAVADIAGARLDEAPDFPGADFTDTNDIGGMAMRAAQGDQQAAQALTGFLKRGHDLAVGLGVVQEPKVAEKSAGQREFESKLEGLTDEQKKEAVLVDLGLSARAVGNAITTIAGDKGLVEQLANAKATIKEREKFAEKTGVSRANTIDKGFERITKIDTGLRNIDRAVEALNQGASVGAIQKLLPSFKAASVALDNIQGLMALDVVGATTFGALSKGELDLAKQVALPTGLDTPQLIQYLQDKKVAQQKLRDYFNEQIQFLDQGGTVAGFLRQKEAEQGQQPAQQQQAAQQAPQTQRLVFDPATGQLVPK